MSSARLFIDKAAKPAFGQALIANLRFHPEWDRILFADTKGISK